MKTLYIEKSTSQVRDGGWVESLDLSGVERIVVGTGPGSFAGIRAAIAFAQGYSLGSKCEVLALPSPCAIAGEMGFTPSSSFPADKTLAVIGDARRGKRWICVFKGEKGLVDVSQVDECDLGGAIPSNALVVSPDDARISNELKALFGDRYLGCRMPTSEGLEAYALLDPSALTADPVPIYLNPAVRT